MKEINELVSISNEIGKFKELVQAGGGNTSIKTQDGKMLIKASGFTFSEMTENSGFVTLDYKKIIKFFENDKEGSIEEKETKYNQILIDSLINQHTIRPSIETGVHVFLDRAVVHTHPIMTNILGCMSDGEKIAKELFSEETPEILWIDYKNPGYNLAKEIKNQVSAYENKKGVKPKIIFLKNHGLIVAGDDAFKCSYMTFKVNEKIRAYLKKTFGIEQFPELKMKIKDYFYFSNNEIIKKFVENLNENEHLLSKFLIPDDVVYCSEFSVKDDTNKLEINKITFVKEGVFYPWNEKKSTNIDEILTAKLYMLMILNKIGKIDYLNEEDVNYIRGMESEKYRQVLVK